MTPLALSHTEFTLVVGGGSFLAGLLGALTGLGGGVVIVPHAHASSSASIFRYAVGASLVSVIATSSGAAAAYVREGYTNIRIGMFLEVATTHRRRAAARRLAGLVSTSVLAVVFGVVLLYSAYLASRPPAEHVVADARSAGGAAAPRRLLSDARPASASTTCSTCRLGFGLMLVAGVLSGLLGIGSGAFKVLAMDQAMRLPFKVSTTTSNFMIGVTAAASAGIYLRAATSIPGIAMPVHARRAGRLDPRRAGAGANRVGPHPRRVRGRGRGPGGGDDPQRAQGAHLAVTTPTPDRWSDEAIETIVGRLLQAGVVLAAALVLIGGVRYLVHHGVGEPPRGPVHG